MLRDLWQHHDVASATAYFQDWYRRVIHTRMDHDFGPILIEQVEKGQALVLVVRHQGTPLGCHYAMLAGQRYTHSMRGTERITPDLRVEHFTLGR